MTDFDDEIDEMQPEEYEDQIDDLRVRGLIDAPAAETETVKHTPGRLEWSTGDPRTRNVGLYMPAHGRIAEVCGDHFPERTANARHLVACWNACEAASIPTEALEDGAVKELLERERAWPRQRQ